MKLNINKILCLIPALLIGLSGCNKEAELYSLPVPDDQMKVTPSVTDIVLERTNAANEAVTFTWGEATDRGKDTKIAYYFRLYQTVNKDNCSELVKVEGERKVTWTVRQLNDLLASWGLLPGDTYSVTAEVIAKVPVSYEYMKPELSFAEINVTTYNPANIMYIVMGEGEDQRTYQMTSTVADENVFTYQGNLPAGSFKFAYDAADAEAFYNGGNGALSFGATGTLFENEVLTYNEIQINVAEKTVDLKSAAPYVYIFAVGSPAPALTIPLENFNYEWYYIEVDAGRAPQGAMIYASLSEDGSNPFVPGENDAIKYISDPATEGYTIGRNNQWSNKYAISIVLNDEYNKFIARDMKVQSEHMYPVGDTFPFVGDWNQGDSYNYFNNKGFFAQTDKMLRPEVFTLTVEFKNAGSEGFKILTQTNNWNDCYHPTDWQADPTKGWQGMRFGGDDWKWRPDSPGVWTIEMDCSMMRLRMVK